ncbi:hypothetical protein [Cohnella luojiensis]|nr:hypothetical protein [Cohnella luojiensis]
MERNGESIQSEGGQWGSFRAQGAQRTSTASHSTAKTVIRESSSSAV